MQSPAVGVVKPSVRETEAEGVTGGNVRPETRVIGAPTRSDGRPLNEKAGDLAVIAGWGHAGQGGRHHAGQRQDQHQTLDG